MNAKRIFDQLMQQAGGHRRQGGVDVQGLVDGLSSRLKGGGGSGGSAGQGGGADMKSLLGGGAMGLLVGSKRGRKLGGKALKYGAIAGAGMLAWKAWQNARGGASADEAHEGQPMERLQGESREQRSLALLQAMIMAARADGHIDEHERARITEQIDALGADDDLHAWVERQLTAPLDALALARQADSPQAAREMYLVSVAVIDDQNPMERAWLDQLASGLELDETMKRELERQALPAA
ncbi:tellurite resistance TerB family protein [Halomonas sp. M4R1S46]|uniref:tellurite resistance TerB family protein n=1 Tax=Halomonas sp. M4R1S46 TaxID=2982692 RepID=UPI0021E4FBC0|nr:tellurite resistance TerB family protein [Halomonas sp. M4R1S46]UYG06374.1 tellurite resistance TerB family protein [Halomonas sp. M4R1S46]